jgi:hypothetical protein
MLFGAGAGERGCISRLPMHWDAMPDLISLPREFDDLFRRVFEGGA